MKDAFSITLGIIFIAVVLGVIYNLAEPYLVRLNVLQDGGSVLGMQKDGGVFGSYDSGRSWGQVIVQDDERVFIRSDIFEFQFNIQNPNTLYAATSGGLFTSEDGGEKWHLVSHGDLQRDASVVAFAIDFKSPWRMYVATRDRSRGRILKSNGGDFYEAYSTQGVDEGVVGVWVDSAETNRLYAATSQGLFLVSEDFGESWKVRKELTDTLSHLALTPGNTRIMYAVLGGEKIIKTLDAGISWSDISETLIKSGESLTINDIALDPQNKNHLYVAASTGLFESKNAGATFVQISILSASDQSSVGAVTVDPKNSDILYIGVGPQIHKSTDGGRSWQIKTLATSRTVRVLKVKLDDSSIIFAGVQHD